MPIDSENVKDIGLQLTAIGMCKICILRYLGEISAESYVQAFISMHGHEEGENDLKIQKCNSCIACLGLLQKDFTDELSEKVKEEILEKDYDCPTFNVALTLPVSFQLRAHSLWLYMTKKYPDHCLKMFPLNLVTITVKDVWKWTVAPLIGKSIHKHYNANSELAVTIFVSYKDDLSESMGLLNMDDKTFQKKRPRHQEKMFSRKSVEAALKIITDEKFSEHYPLPPGVPTAPVSCENISLQHSSIFFAGRYNKLSRNLPQTPWLIDGERKMEDSVLEIISRPIERLCIAQGVKLIASGREDVDVRTLGRGRPFAVECLDPHRTNFLFKQIRDIESKVNETGYGKVAIRDLQLVPKDSLNSLKKGEEEKTKEYCALCVVHGPLPDNLTTLSSIAPLTLDQRTPVRVLHRRPAASRPKVVHKMSVAPVNSDVPDYSFFKLCVLTQAGTYIKEFVHGDFGRTKPSVGDLLGGINVDILALDVMNVNLDWPPSILK